MMPTTKRPRLLSRFFLDLTLTRKAFLNVLAGATDYFVRIAVAFAIAPLMVAGLGDFLYGAWRVLLGLGGYLGATTGRPTQALKWKLSALQSSSDYGEKRIQVGSALLVSVLFLPLLLALSAACVVYLPSWLAAPPELWPVLRLATAIVAFNMAIVGLVEIPRSILEGENIGFRRMGLSALLSILNGLLVVGALNWNAGLVGVAAATVVTSALTGFLFLRVTRTYVPWLGIEWPDRATLRSFFDLSGWFLVWRLVMSWMMAADVLLLGTLASVELVTSYSLSKYVPEAIVNVVGIAVFGIAPGLGRIIGAGQLEWAAKVRSELMAITWLATTTLGALVLLWNESFVTLWVGGDYFFGSAENALLMLVTIQLIFIRNDANVIDLSLNLRAKVLLGLFSAVLATGLAILLVRQFELGVAGLCLGFLAGRSLLTVAYPLLVCRILQLSPGRQFAGALRAAATTAAVFFVSARADLFVGRGSWVVVESWGGLIVAVTGSVILLAGACFLLGLSGSQRALVVKRLRGLSAG